MSSLKRRLLASPVLALALAAAGCGFTPLYGTDPSGIAVTGELAAIEIGDPRTRLEQAVRNELVFLFTGGGAPAATRYRMRLTVEERVSDLVIEQVSGRPTASALTLKAAAVVTDARTGVVVFNDAVETSASFDQSTQRFANERARLNAGLRAAKTAARRLSLRIAAALKTR